MHIVIAAVGKAKAGPERSLVEEYTRRLPWKVEIREVEEKRPLPPPQRKAREAEYLLAAVDRCTVRVAMDAKGKQPASTEFASLLARWQETSGPVGFIIGGADGLDATVIKQSQYTLSLGAMTWPHMLVRAMLAEQLWRGYSILNNHPYHRE